MIEKDSPPLKKILCISDQPGTLEIFSQYLGDTDYQFMAADNAKAGIAIAKINLPDLIFASSGIYMADFENRDQKLNQIPYIETTPLIIICASENDQNKVAANRARDIDDYLVQPFSQETLLAKLTVLLRIKALKDETAAANEQVHQAISRLKRLKAELERKNQALLNEKRRLQSSLKQISSMIEERENTNQKLGRLLEKQKKDFNSLTALLSSAIESKRQYHRGHSKKVAEISVFIAKEFKLSSKTIRRVEIAALLHEIGKISIPDELALKNPKDYSQQEKDFLVQHPVQGAMMLSKFSGFKKVAEIIKYFHENQDGTGVPEGLKGKDIPLGSRIIRVAGAYDNLVYRNQDISVERAFEIIEDRIGSRYDSMVVHYLRKYAQQNPVEAAGKIKLHKIFELEAGMILASGIFTVNGTKLLPMNTVLTDESINQIAHYNTIEPIQDTVFVKD
jgi:putative nucleotidyltransferase with HDIG domain